MSNHFADLLRKTLTSGDITPATVDSLMSALEQRDERNKVFSRELITQLAGNHRLTLNERPDGSGFFYGDFHDENDTPARVDVMPPRPLWSGDFNAEAAHPTDWVVYLDGEEVQRAASIDGLSVLAGV